MNKKGDEKFLSIWMFIVWGLIFTGIVAGTIMFFGAEFDTKEIQGDNLVNRLADCFIDNGEFIEVENVFDECNLKESAFEEGNFYFNISYEGESIYKGDIAFEVECFLNGRYFPKCSEENFVVMKDGEEIKIKILAGSNYFGGRL